MARIDPFDGLAVFLTVARLASFRATARELGVTAGAVSQAIRTLEMRLGVLLFVRTTRRVALTEAGAIFLRDLAGVDAQVEAATRRIASSQSQPAGMLRLCARRMAVQSLLTEALPAFRQTYPAIGLDVEVRDGPFDLMAERFDAGIRIGEFIEPDMIAVKLGEPIRWIVVGSPAYLARHGVPLEPADLVQHRRIGYRFAGQTTPYRWEFRDQGRDIRVDPDQDIVVTDSDLLCALAVANHGLAYLSQVAAQQALNEGSLTVVLERFMPATDNLFLYFPARAQSQPKVRAFIDFLTGFRRTR